MGHVVTECPVSTPDGVKAIDVGWLAPERGQRRRFALRYSLLPTPLVKSTKRSPSTLRQGHERFGSVSKTEPLSSTSQARQRSANHPSFVRSSRHSPALKRCTRTRIPAPR